MNAPFVIENNLWNAVCVKDNKALANYFTENSIIVFDGTRYSGNDFINVIIGKKIDGYAINSVEVIANEGNIYQILYSAQIFEKQGRKSINTENYVILTTSICSENSDEVLCSMIYRLK